MLFLWSSIVFTHYLSTNLAGISQSGVARDFLDVE